MGKIKNFSGIDDPYEPPLGPEIIIDAVNCSAEENADHILAYLIDKGFVIPSMSLLDEEGESSDNSLMAWSEA
jgi:hypothetical protein